VGCDFHCLGDHGRRNRPPSGSSLDFYRRAFGFKTRHFDEEMQYGELDTGETALAFAAHETGTEVTQGVICPACECQAPTS
jgi:hypothetical protein